MKRHNVLLLIPNLGLGGAQRVFNDHSTELAKQYHITGAVFNLGGDDKYENQNDVINLNVDGGGSSFHKLQNFYHRIIRLRNIKLQQSVEVCISHLEGADYVNLLSKGKEKTILCIHGSKMHDRNIKGLLGWIRLRILIPLLYRQASCIVTVSKGICTELVGELGLPAHKVRVINNFFDDKKIRQQASITPPAPYAEVLVSYPILATAGRLASEKNIIALLEVFALVRQHVPQCKLLLVGQGEQYQAILERCRILQLATHLPEQSIEVAQNAAVLLTGFQSNPHMFIARSTVFVLPSLNEGFPMALGEAMVCGRPVVAADCPTGPREILAPATTTPAMPIRLAERATYGVLMPILHHPDTLAADQLVWAETLCKLLNNPVEREQLSQLATQRMEAFTRDKILRQWVDVIEEVLVQ